VPEAESSIVNEDGLGPYTEEVSGEEFSCDVVVASMDGWQELALTEVNLWAPKLQRLSDDELLIVDNRGWPRDAQNACVYR